MAKKSTTNSTSARLVNSVRRKRPGAHSKKKNSVSKTSKHYKKKYRGQGR